VLLHDEPLEAMDHAMRDTILAWVEAEHGRGSTVLVATHVVEPFSGLATAVVEVANGRVGEARALDQGGRADWRIGGR
jgi:ABC-type thiamine transport system ATPase subunit